MSINIGGPSNFNVTQWNGTAVTTPDTAGSPKVTVTAGSGTGQILLTAGAVTVGTNNDKTGYSLTAGSYSVRASDIQTALIDLSAVSTATATVSSVTTTRSKLLHAGHNVTSGVDHQQSEARFTLTNSTTVTADRASATNRTIPRFFLEELF